MATAEAYETDWGNQMKYHQFRLGCSERDSFWTHTCFCEPLVFRWQTIVRTAMCFLKKIYCRKYSIGKPPHGNRNQSVYCLLFSCLLLMLVSFTVGWLVVWFGLLAG